MQVTHEFPDVFLTFEHRKYRIRVMSWPYTHKRYGKKWMLCLSYLRPMTKYELTHKDSLEAAEVEGDNRWINLHENASTYEYWWYFDIPFIWGWKKIFARTMAEEYDIIKAHIEKDYAKLTAKMQEDNSLAMEHRKVYNNLVNELEGN